MLRVMAECGVEHVRAVELYEFVPVDLTDLANPNNHVAIGPLPNEYALRTAEGEPPRWLSVRVDGCFTDLAPTSSEVAGEQTYGEVAGPSGTWSISCEDDELTAPGENPRWFTLRCAASGPGVGSLAFEVRDQDDDALAAYAVSIVVDDLPVQLTWGWDNPMSLSVGETGNWTFSADAARAYDPMSPSVTGAVPEGFELVDAGLEAVPGADAREVTYQNYWEYTWTAGEEDAGAWDFGFEATDDEGNVDALTVAFEVQVRPACGCRTPPAPNGLLGSLVPIAALILRRRR
jgi:hypothetical protein